MWLISLKIPETFVDLGVWAMYHLKKYRKLSFIYTPNIK